MNYKEQFIFAHYPTHPGDRKEMKVLPECFGVTKEARQGRILEHIIIQIFDIMFIKPNDVEHSK